MKVKQMMNEMEPDFDMDDSNPNSKTPEMPNGPSFQGDKIHDYKRMAGVKKPTVKGSQHLTYLGHYAKDENIAQGHNTVPNMNAPLGQGGRFEALKEQLAAKGAYNPAGLAAYIGRKKYGDAKFASLGAKGKKGK